MPITSDTSKGRRPPHQRGNNARRAVRHVELTAAATAAVAVADVVTVGVGAEYANVLSSSRSATGCLRRRTLIVARSRLPPFLLLALLPLL